MRWDSLFDDLESQLEQELGAEEVDLLAEEERLRRGRLVLRDRLLTITRPGHGGAERIRIVLRHGSTVTIAVGSIGRDWLAGELDGPRRGSCLVPFSAIASLLPTMEQLALSLLPDPPAEPAASLSARLGLAFVLRDLCRRRAAIEVATASEQTLHGTIDRVGRDHLDLAEHEAGAPRRASAVDRIRILPFDEIVLVRF